MADGEQGRTENLTEMEERGLMMANVLANRHFAAGRVWARLLEPKPGPPQSVRLSDQLGHSEEEHKLNWFQQREEFEHTKATLLSNCYLNT